MTTPLLQSNLATSSWHRMLEARPLRNDAASVTQEDGGTLSVRVPRARPRYLVPPLSWIVNVASHRQLFIDRLGGGVWRLCDGSRTVEQVIDAFASDYKLTFHEARVSVTSYLKLLIQRGVLAIELPKGTDNTVMGETR